MAKPRKPALAQGKKRITATKPRRGPAARAVNLCQVTLLVEHKGWQRLPGLAPRIKRAVRATIDHLPAKLRFPCSATLLLTSNAAIRRLNRDFRGMDKATNVLSFPQHEPARLPKTGRLNSPVELGDIAIAYQYIVDEAKVDRKMLINHLTHLFIHGLLHLFGYDHLMAADAESMEGLERKIMASLNLPDPYAADILKTSPRTARS